MTTVDYDSMSVEQLEQTAKPMIERLPTEHRDQIKPLFDALVQRASAASTSSSRS